MAAWGNRDGARGATTSSADDLGGAPAWNLDAHAQTTAPVRIRPMLTDLLRPNLPKGLKMEWRPTAGQGAGKPCRQDRELRDPRGTADLHQRRAPVAPEIGLRSSPSDGCTTKAGRGAQELPLSAAFHYEAALAAPSRKGPPRRRAVALAEEKTSLSEARSHELQMTPGGAHARDPRSAPPADFSFMSPPHDGASHPKAWSRAHRRREPLFFTRRVTISRREIDGRMTETRQQTGTTPA
jgi:hypothetical protein